MRPELLIVGAAVLWGTTGTAQDLGDVAAPPVAVGTVRILIGGLLLTVVAATTLRSGRGGLSSAVRLRGQNGGWGANLVGIVAVAAYQASFFAAVDRAGVALGTLVAIGSGPVFTGIVAAVASGERPVSRWYPATGLAVVGCGLLLAPGGDSELDGVGLLLALGAGLSYAVYTVAAKAVLDRGVPGTQVMATFFLGGALLLLPTLLVADTDGLASGRGLAMVAWLGVVTVTASYVLFSAGLDRLRSSTVATLSLTEPLTAALLGVVVLDERPGWLAAVGAVVLLSGLVVITTDRTAVPDP
ncbi:MAG TPA: EamA family transporter [Acidimicrobiales bacterium]|nr:EamA family transporter [Acidimicrobiales bacterium]